MAKTKKKGSKNKKKATRTPVTFSEMPLDQVMAKGEQQLSSGNAREALKIFKYLKGYILISQIINFKITPKNFSYREKL